MPPWFKNAICYNLFLFFFGCAILPSENVADGESSGKENACREDRLQPFRKPLSPLLASPESDLHLISQGRGGKAPGRSNRLSIIRPSTTLLVDARFDRVILPVYAEQLWKKMGKPPRIQIPAGHYTAGLFLPYIRSTALRHFQSTLG